MANAQIHARGGRESETNPGAATGFVVVSVATRTWHLDPGCGALRGRRRAAFNEPTLAELTAMLLDAGCAPCRRCTIAAIWDDLAERATSAGYHYLSCDDYHTNRGCSTCASLARYAAARDVLATAVGGRVMILAGGTGDQLDEYPAGGPLAIGTTTGTVPATVTAPMWAFAATRVGPICALGPALAAAAALHAEPVAPRLL